MGVMYIMMICPGVPFWGTEMAIEMNWWFVVHENCQSGDAHSSGCRCRVCFFNAKKIGAG
ncbi:hypothetical protein BO78DRAFT_397897 [Aspergillus sclerotiicarbonarius CBS 121057]|uniref:Uncharacterized protein n=1 Tax=Aspergillus sclerotiicarbonarius (strain CBS 121057 / IBT 28362) TaxID=1448318 RepID=A0A319EQ18_ASPSB|nr:hypothetical protein BO78DRAFT_397897 [Aspergillus sclerotiicarbonarius CBS 121057]